MPTAFGVYETLTIGHTTWVPAYNVTFLEAFKVSPGYEILTFGSWASTAFCIATGCGFDAYFMESCFYLSGHLKIIQERFREILFSSNDDNALVTERKIALTVNYHNRILKACAVLQDIVLTGIFPFLVLDSMLLCTIFYTVIMVGHQRIYLGF